MDFYVWLRLQGIDPVSETDREYWLILFSYVKKRFDYLT